jgi:7-carboxy-7-deazaguanine synthase
MKVVEVYTSIQGEGPHAGEPTTFIRFGGCNLRCAGWGSGELPDGTTVGGCDTIFAVYPEWRTTWGTEGVDSILRQVPHRPRRICITGGEPLIQPTQGMEALVRDLFTRGHTIDLFTNGTKALPLWTDDSRVTVVMDYKLPGSGEYGKFLHSNVDRIVPNHLYLKFVCKDLSDFEMAVLDIEGMELNKKAKILFGIVWDGDLTNQELSALILKRAPYADLNVQMHNHIWPPNERGR